MTFNVAAVWGGFAAVLAVVGGLSFHAGWQAASNKASRVQAHMEREAREDMERVTARMARRDEERAAALAEISALIGDIPRNDRCDVPPSIIERLNARRG